MVFISEIDSEVKPILVKKSEAALGTDAAHFLTESGTGYIEERPVDEFFARLVLDREWHGDKERSMVRQYKTLQELLYANLTHLRQYRAGKIKVTIYVVGYDNEGNLAGIITNAVET